VRPGLVLLATAALVSFALLCSAGSAAGSRTGAQVGKRPCAGKHVSARRRCMKRRRCSAARRRYARHRSARHRRARLRACGSRRRARKPPGRRTVPVPPAATTPPSAPAAPSLGRFLSVSAREFSLTLSRPAVAPGSVSVELRNVGEDPHDLVLSPDDGSHTPLASFAETPSGGVQRHSVALSAGRYLLWCSLPGHEAAGMSATLRVGD
jgi:hypothetical protein